jgi:hypothetical protein
MDGLFSPKLIVISVRAAAQVDCFRIADDPLGIRLFPYFPNAPRTLQAVQSIEPAGAGVKFGQELSRGARSHTRTARLFVLLHRAVPSDAGAFS